MEGYEHEHKEGEQHDHLGAADASSSLSADSGSSTSGSTGSSVQEADFNAALDDAFEAPKAPASSGSIDDHDHAPDTTGNSNPHVSQELLSSARGLDSSKTQIVKDLNTRIGRTGDFLDGGTGNDVVIGSRSKDLIMGTGGGFNVMTLGGGGDTVVLGKETTNKIFDFEKDDKFVLADGLTFDDIAIVKGNNPGKGGLDQPLDSENNVLIVDKTTNHILAALTFADESAITESTFKLLGEGAVEKIDQNRFSNINIQDGGDGQLNGTKGSDRLAGGSGDDFLYVGNDGFKLNAMTSGEEFPFATDSPGEFTVNFELKDGNLKASGKYENADGAPLFSQGETTIDPTATFNGGNAEALVEGFLRVPEDVEGNKITGLHMHFSTAGDDRGNFADATVIRYFDVDPVDAKSGTISGDFNLSPEEQAAFLAGNLYMNLHTNVDLDGDGKGGFANGEMRGNANKNVVRL
ncbi:CHRD domain-containing protein [Oculatella sp. LEGE 06141]|uniref:CHRD domain-containing protein n=1 Tax=Oculatella sp. LEGE 06141 TaxID=1828648 RepID=UPI00187F07D6|nr:CHRD domain-containing protein [Oculatella sp. LEGE 06141]MBE9181972.1 CHRD domain-containing protein [Oculatella sp. LEGE 06141]